MANPHPRENQMVNGLSTEMTWLAYFAARCPLPYATGAEATWGAGEMAQDCRARIEWARTMLHALWPVPA